MEITKLSLHLTRICVVCVWYVRFFVREYVCACARAPLFCLYTYSYLPIYLYSVIPPCPWQNSWRLLVYSIAFFEQPHVPVIIVIIIISSIILW